MNKIQSANITATLAAGSTTSPYNYLVNVTQRLCFPTCVDETPVFIPQYSLVSSALVSTGLYSVTINVQGSINYVPCNGGCACTKTQPLNQNFTILIASATVPTIAIAQGATSNAVSASACQSCSRTFVSETPLTVTVS
jgi:hypothetical protein